LNKINIIAPAKINIGLSIVSKRSDGFHNLETVFYQIHDLYDELLFEKSDSLKLLIDKDIQGLVKDNIIIKSVEALQKFSGQKLNCRISLKKKIPIGAGLGGGSSDAAATLKGIVKLFDIKISDNNLKEIALQLGSDVPLFLHDYPTLGKGRGEVLEKTNLKIDYPILLVNPGIHISTKDAFENIIPKANSFDYSLLPEYQISLWNKFIVNNFEENIFQKYSEIENIKSTMLSNGAIFSLMSGTGSTVYGIFATEEEARKTSTLFPELYFTFVGNIK